MKRNRGKFNQKPSHSPRLAGGNILTMEQRRLVEKQQEMLRNISLNQGMASYPAQEIQMQSPFNPISSLLSSLGSVLPTTGLLPSLLTGNNILPLMSSPAMVPPPSMIPLSNAQGQSSLFGPGPSNTSFFDGVESQFQSRDLGEHRSKGFKKNNRTWDKPKQLISSQDSEFDRPFPSSSSFEEQSWITKNNNSNEGLNWSSSNVEMQRNRPTHTQNKNSFPKPWNKDVQAERPRFEKQKEGNKGVPRDRLWTNNSWNDKTFNSERGFNDRRGGQIVTENLSQVEEPRWVKNSGERVWGKRSRESQENSWRDSDSKSDGFHGENSAKRLKTSDNSWAINQKEQRDESWEGKSNAYEGKSLSSKYVEPEKNWNSSSKEQEEKWDNRESWESKQQKNDEGNSWRVKSLDPNDKSLHSKDPVNSWSEKAKDFSGCSRRPASSERNWSDKSLNKDQERLNSNMGNKLKIGKNNLRETKYADKFDRGAEESLTGSKGNEDSLSKKDFWKVKKNETKEKLWVPPSNFLYPDPENASASGVWSRLDSGGDITISSKSMREEGNREHDENLLMESKNTFGQDGGWDGLKNLPLVKSLEDPNLQMKIRYLDSQLGQLDERMFQIHSLTSIPGQATPALPVVWDNQSAMFSQGEIVNTIAENNDLRVLLQSKAKDSTKVDTSKSNTGGWTDTMVLVYPFLKSTMSLPDILDLKSQLSEQIHSLLDDNNQDIQPRFYGTAMVCKNWFMVHCADQQSVDWLLNWKPHVKAKTRMKLCMRKAIDAVKVTHVSIVLKGIKESIRDIEIRLINQNQHLEPHMWRRGPHTFSQNDTTVSFLVDAACLRLLEASLWEVYYELTKFKVKIVEHKPIIPLAYTTQYLNPL